MKELYILRCEQCKKKGVYYVVDALNYCKECFVIKKVFQEGNT